MRRGHLKYRCDKKRIYRQYISTFNAQDKRVRGPRGVTVAIKARRVTDVSNKPHRRSFYWAIKFYPVARAPRYYNASVLCVLSTPLKTHFRELSRLKTCR